MKVVGVLVANIIMLSVVTCQPIILSISTTPLTIGSYQISKIADKNINMETYFMRNIPEESGVWIITKYDDEGYKEVKLDIDLYTFKLMLDGGGWKYYTLSMEKTNDTRVGLQFTRTKIYVQQNPVDVIQTHFTMDTYADTSKKFEISLEARFPFYLLKSKYYIINSILHGKYTYFLYKYLPRFLHIGDESYFSLRNGFFSSGINGGPNHIETRFFFGRNSISDPRAFRFIVNPSDLDKKYPLTYNASYITFDSYGNEVFRRGFSLTLNPSAEIQITSIPREGKINYNFGRGNGISTDISFQAFGGRFQDIIHHFIIDPLPSYMNFDLTLLGERSFIYESSETYDVTYKMDSVEGDNLVAIEINSLPNYIKGEWNLLASGLTVQGFIDLNMSSDISKATLLINSSNIPFLEVKNFPRKLRLESSLDIPNLRGDIKATKYSGKTTTLTIPIRYKNWMITGVIKLNNNGGRASFDLPSNGDNHVSIGIDTDDTPLFGFSLSLVDMEIDKEVLYISVDAIATDDLSITFDSYQSGIKNFRWNGIITQLIDLVVSIDFQGTNIAFNGSWIIGESGSLELEINTPVEINFGNITGENFKFNGYISLNEDSYLKLEWKWGEIGYFMVYTDKPIGDNLYLEIGYGMQDNNVYEYGLKASATGFLDIKRTIKWDTQDGHIPRIWILGDKPFPGNWDVWLLWKYNWYEVI